MNEAASILRRERWRRRLSPGDLAHLLRAAATRLSVDGADLDSEVVLEWESGTRPLTFRHLRLLADVLDISIGDLMGLTAEGRRRDWLVLVSGADTMATDAVDTMLRRRFLHYVAILAGSAVFEHERLVHALAEARIDRRLIGDLAALTDTYGASMWTGSPDPLLPTLEGHFAILRRLLFVPGAPRELTSLAGRPRLRSHAWSGGQGDGMLRRSSSGWRNGWPRRARILHSRLRCWVGGCGSIRRCAPAQHRWDAR
jgi:hypothetical protein